MFFLCSLQLFFGLLDRECFWCALQLRFLFPFFQTGHVSGLGWVVFTAVGTSVEFAVDGGIVWFSLSLHLPQCPLHTLPWWPNFWHLKHLRGFGMYCCIFH